MWTKTVIFLMLLSALYFLINSLFFLDYPPVWPDEAEYADISLNVLQKGKMSTNLFHEVFQDKPINSYPPLMFYFYAVLYKLFGFSIEVQRVFTILTGFLFLIIFYLFLNKLLNNRRLVVFPLVLLTVDWTFMRAARVSRPEIFIMFFSFIAFYIIITTKKIWGYLASGLVFGLAILIHPYAIVNLTIALLFLLFRDKFKGLKKIVFFLFPLLLALLFWLFLLDFNIGYLLEGLGRQTLRKSMESGFFTQFLHIQDYGYTLLNLSLLSGSVFSLIYLIINRKIKYSIFLIIALIVSWLFIFKGKQGWYYVYPVPFLYLAYGVIIKKEWSNLKTSIVPYLVMVFMILNAILNIKLNYQFIVMFQNNAFSYDLFNKSVVKIIPNKTTVFISSIPDPYFALKKNKTINLRHFIAGPGLKDKYLEILDNSDYAVYTGALDIVYGDLLDKYLNLNKSEITQINNGNNQYRGLVIKLKPISERVYPKN